MRRRDLKEVLPLVLAPTLLVVLLASGCVDEDVLYPDQASWAEANDGIYGFLGYSDPAEKVPTCWSCHPALQAQWQETAHADAWAGLQSSGHAAEYT